MENLHQFFLVLMIILNQKAESGVTRRTPEIQALSSKSFFNNTPSFIQRSNAIILQNYEDAGHQSQKVRHFAGVERFNDDAMLFPTEKSTTDILMVQNVAVLTEESFLEEDIPGYPIKEIRKLLDQNPLLKGYFSAVPDLGTRNKEHEEGLEDLCEIKIQKSFYPRKLKNIYDEDVFIVNDVKEGYLQVVEYKECGRKNTKCKYDMFGYSSICVQKYETKQMMIYSNSSQKLVFDQFKVPACCVCMIKKLDK